MTKDEAMSEALAALKKAIDDPNPDYSWADKLPEAPPIPKAPDETIAVIGPKPNAK